MASKYSAQNWWGDKNIRVSLMYKMYVNLNILLNSLFIVFPENPM